MPYKYNPLIGKLDYFESSHFRGVFASAPSYPQQGWTYVNSGDNTLYIYYGSSWQALHVLIPAALEYLLTEAGDFLLLENGDKFVKE